jgi:spore coat protein A
LLSFYPNRQDATALWYHDHAIGITRLNMLAGLFGLYLIRDDTEDALKLPAGKYEIPLVLYDRSFRSDGQLYYPVSTNPDKPWVPEFFGDTILANGTLFPFLDTEPRQYRFRLLNASNSRFLYLSLSNGQTLWQIGSDQGLLAAPIEMHRITLAPGERADLVIDFQEARGENVTLHSDDYAVLQFRTSKAPVTETAALPSRLRPIDRIAEREAVATRLLTLEGGGNPDDPRSMYQPLLLNGASWHEPVTENPRLNMVEIWSFINVTEDSHPIHLHLVRFQILDRRAFDVFTYLNDRQLRYTGPPILPEPDEAGWKDTVRAHPGMVTRIIIRFEGFAGRYVWHCHVLEHEDNEMMRPYDVLPPTASAAPGR